MVSLRWRYGAMTGLLVVGLLLPPAIAQSPPDSVNEAPIPFIDYANDSKLDLNAPISRREYVYWLHEGIMEYLARRDAAVQVANDQCRYAASANRLIMSRVETFQAEAEQLMTAVRSELAAAKTVDHGRATKLQPPDWRDREAALIEEAVELFGIDLRSPDGQFEGDRLVTRREFINHYNAYFDAVLDDSYDDLPLLAEEAYRDLDLLVEDLVVAREQLARLRSLAHSHLLKATTQPVDDKAPERVANALTHPMSDYNEQFEVYAFAAQFMDDFGVDLRVTGDRLNPEEPLTQVQLIDDLFEVHGKLHLAYAVETCGSIPITSLEVETIRLPRDLREAVQATEFEIRTLIGQVQQAVTGH